jgi:predicted metal-dependent phosphoesterase TrpH
MIVRIDLHTHSHFSFDGFSEPEEMVREARRRGLQGFAITDHDTCAAVDYFRQAGLMRDDGIAVDNFLIIPGQEISTAEGHLLALGVRLPDLRGIAAREAVGLVHAFDGVAIAAHPFDRFRHGLARRGESILDALDLDGVECLNSACTFMGSNGLASEYAFRRKLTRTGGSDAHFSALIGSAWTEMDIAELSVTAVINALKKGNAKPAGTLCTRRQRVRKAASWFSRALIGWGSRAAELEGIGPS